MKSKYKQKYSNLVRFRDRIFSMWHDRIIKQTVHERLTDIINCSDHMFYKGKSFYFCALRNRYYMRLFLK